MDYSRDKIEVFEVNENGEIVENYLWDAYEINEAINEGRNIIQFGWHEKRLFNPIWDFESQEWVEGLSQEEVEQKEQEIEERQNILTDEELNAMAIMELGKLIMDGGV